MLSSAGPDRYHFCSLAARLFLERGFDHVTMSDIATAAGKSEAALFAHFGNKQDIILFLYRSINSDWQLFVQELSPGPLATRFGEAMRYKIQLVKPFRGLLSSLMGMLLQHHKVGVQSETTAAIRTQGLHTLRHILALAPDAAVLEKKLRHLAPMLYMTHWAILFLYIQTGEEDQALASLQLAVSLLQRAGKRTFLLPLFPFFKDIGDWAGRMLDVSGEEKSDTDQAIAKLILHYRKTTGDLSPGLLPASLPELIHAFTVAQRPLHFILPAFPAKSPNRNKVLGALPDLGEQIGLQTLEALCLEIRSIYPPGAQVTICSDGRIFSDLVGVSDEEITCYVQGIRAMIGRLSLTSVSIVNLEDLMPVTSFEEGRRQVLERYAEPLTELEQRVKTHPQVTALYNGIHRFITEDRAALHPEMSRSKVKELSKPVALSVIRNSNAWTRFLAYVFPEAIRLSIHPYPADSDKIGFKLTRAADNWLTPWHGVIVLQEEEYILMKKSEAEALGARLVYEDGRPYYYTLTQTS